MSVGGVFGVFEGEDCGLSGSENIIRFVWLGFVSREVEKLAAGLCNSGGRFQVRLERHCQLVGDKKGCVESLLDPC